MPLAAGLRLGSYEILAPLGAGGMGEVYRARDTRLRREVALKVLPESVARDPERLDRFEREARMVAALNHPNIVVLHSIEREGELHFFTMELVEGETLDRSVGPPGLPWPRLLELAAPLIEALGAAHEKGVVHRDLKPRSARRVRRGHRAPAAARRELGVSACDGARGPRGSGRSFPVARALLRAARFRDRDDAGGIVATQSPLGSAMARIPEKDSLGFVSLGEAAHRSAHEGHEAEYPNYTRKMFHIDKLSEVEQDKIIEKDKKQYLARFHG